MSEEEFPCPNCGGYGTDPACVEMGLFDDHDTLCCGICNYATTPADYEGMAHHLGKHAMVFRDQLKSIRGIINQTL